jgi:hypothetical protein
MFPFYNQGVSAVRKILLALVIVSIVCVSAFAAWHMSQTPAFDEAGLCAALSNLTPTEAEAKAISALREKSLAQWAMSVDKADAAGIVFTVPDVAVIAEKANVAKAVSKLPVEAEPVDDENVMMMLQYHYFSAQESFIKKVVGHHAMSWSGFPLEPQGSYGNVPVHVRYLEQDNAQKFNDILLLDKTNQMEGSPTIMLLNGQDSEVHAMTSIPFVTTALPIETESGMGCVPIIQNFDTGWNAKSKVTLLQDGSCRLNCQFEFARVEKSEYCELLTPRDERWEDKDGTAYRRTSGGITVQFPTFRTFRAEIPDIVIPEGMSLLVAFPGAFLPGERGEEGMFLLLTPRKAECQDANASL